MPSVYELLYESSDEIDERAREEDVPKRGSMRKGEKIAALADEDIREDLVAEVLLSKKTDDGNGLVGKAKEIGVDSPHSKTKAELQEIVLEDRLNEAGTGASGASSSHDGAVAPSGDDGLGRLPQSGRTTHFESAEERENQIRKFAQRAASKAVDEQATFVVVESFRPKDAKEPLKIKRAYMERHPDTIVVFEARAPHLTFPIQSAEKNPVFREET